MLTHRHNRRRFRAFTLVEVLAALLFMAIVIPVTMQGITVASRAGSLGQRKAVAMRIADRVLNELIITGQTTSGVGSGNVIDGDTTYPWTMKSETWSEDAMTQMTVTVSFDVQGSTFDVSASTLFDPAVNAITTTSATQ
jgi:type II secretory pathway pseudopilin PulG